MEDCIVSISNATIQFEKITEYWSILLNCLSVLHIKWGLMDNSRFFHRNTLMLRCTEDD